MGIVGAGMAGLRAAGILVNGGWDVTVFEAKAQVGGRVCGRVVVSKRALERDVLADRAL